MHLGDIYDVIEDCKEYYYKNGYYGKPIDWNDRDAIYFNNGQLENAIEFKEYHNMNQAIIFNDTLDIKYKEELIEEIKKGAIL